MGGSICNIKNPFDKIQVPNLEKKSIYGQQSKRLDKMLITSMYNLPQQYDKTSMVYQMITKSMNNQFFDQKFDLKHEKGRLSELLNYEKNNIKVFQRNNNTQTSSFVQFDVELSYLACVFYFFCSQNIKKQWLEHVLNNNKIEDKGYYVLNFYCNGTHHSVVIDDFVPTNKQSFMYLRIVRGQQIWPLLMEKAWAKQIGSYNKALGLSPEDAFQQITGIPSYSYHMKHSNISQMKKFISNCWRQQKWITFVARERLSDIVNRQVFYLKSIQNGYYTIISPYTKFQFQTDKQTKKGQVKIRQESFFDHFEYLVVGHYRQNFKNSSIHVQSKHREQLIYQFNVSTRQEISIRFNQFYKGYLSQEYTDKYRYSPVLMQIYQIIEDQNQTYFVLRQNEQGCSRAYHGARSIYSSKNIFEQFNPGRYFIRMEVDWSHPQYLNQGNLNIYSFDGLVKLQKIQNNNQFLFQVYPSIIRNKLLQQKIENSKQVQQKTLYYDAVYRQVKERSIFYEDLSSCGLAIITFQKKNTTLMMFQNLSEFPQNFEVSFEKSQNIFIRGGQVSGKKTVLRLKKNSFLVIELVPVKISQESQINNYQIVKLKEKKG